jgi:PPOX class probable F420-dependent enzyme
MLDKIPASHRDLLADETKAFAFVGTTMPDGSPQVTPVWFNTEDGYILINSAKGRVKDENLRARPEIALAIMDFKRPYHYLQIRGRVVAIDEQQGAAHIHTLSHKYRGEDYSIPKGQVRVVYKIQVESFSVM